MNLYNYTASHTSSNWSVVPMENETWKGLEYNRRTNFRPEKARRPWWSLIMLNTNSIFLLITLWSPITWFLEGIEGEAACAVFLAGLLTIYSPVVHMYVCVYIYIHTHTHTHTYIYIKHLPSVCNKCVWMFTSSVSWILTPKTSWNRTPPHKKKSLGNSVYPHENTYF